MVDEGSRAKKVRQSRSCKVCKLRKVKVSPLPPCHPVPWPVSLISQCDRVKPCHACCAHGYPSKCIYESIPDDDLHPINQAEEIRNLRAEIRDLRGRVDGQGRTSGCPPFVY